MTEETTDIQEELDQQPPPTQPPEEVAPVEEAPLEAAQTEDAPPLEVESSPAYEEADDEVLVDFSLVRDRVREVIDAGQLDQASQFLEQFARWPDTTRRLDDNIWLHRHLGDLYRALEQNQEALDAYERAFSLDPSALEVLNPYSELLFEQGQAKRGLRVLQSLLLCHKYAMSPAELVAIYHRLGGCYEATDNLDKARSAYEKALEHSQNDSKSLAGLLRVVTNAGQPQEIIKVRQRLIRSMNDGKARSMAMVALGDDWAEKFNDPHRAIDTYETALSHDPKNAQALQRIANLCAEMEDWRRVSRSYFTLSRISETREEEADWLIRASDIARNQLWEPEKALAGYRRAVELDPSRLDAFKVITSIMVDDEDWEGLKQAYVNIITAHMKGDEPDVKLLTVLCQKLGDLCQNQLGQVDEAIRAYDQASALMPQSVELHERVAALAEKEADFLDTALTHLQAIQTLEPSTPGILDRIGRVYLRKKDVERAYCVFRTLVYQEAPLDDKARQFVERFNKPIYRAPKRPLSIEMLKRYVFSEQLDRRISSVFGILKLGLDEWVGETRSKHGLRRRDRVKIEEQLAFNNIYRSVGKLLMYESLPELWRKPEQDGLINGALHPEGMIVGDNMTSSVNEKEIAFAVGKQLFLFLSPFYLAAIRPREVEAFFRIGMAYAANQSVNGGEHVIKVLKKKIRGAEHQQLQKVVQDITSRADDPNIPQWLEAVEDSANRVGFIFCDDLDTCEAYLRNEPQPISNRPVKTRMESLVNYALSDEYIELRELLGMSVG